MDARASENLVVPEDACPICGERDADCLLWDEDGERVTCTECGKVYVPPRTEGGDDAQA